MGLKAKISSYTYFPHDLQFYPSKATLSANKIKNNLEKKGFPNTRTRWVGEPSPKRIENASLATCLNHLWGWGYMILQALGPITCVLSHTVRTHSRGWDLERINIIASAKNANPKIPIKPYFL